MRSLYIILILIVSLLCVGYAVSTTAQPLTEKRTQSQNANSPVLIYQVETKYLQNISPRGGYTRVKFINTSGRAFSAIAFEVVPYAWGSPILEAVKRPVVFGAKGDFKPGETYTVTSEKPVWPATWNRVNCVHIVGLMLEYVDGQTQRIGKAEIADYLRPQIAAQNCSNPSSPGPHN